MQEQSAIIQKYRPNEPGKQLMWMLLILCVVCCMGAGVLVYKMRSPSAGSISTPPAGFQTMGMDVSYYQGNIDWERLVSTEQPFKPHFVFIRATYGNIKSDHYFKRNWQKARRAKVIRGAYHYYVPTVNSEQQANFFIKRVRLSSGDLPPVLDIEEIGPWGVKNTLAGIRNWLKIVEGHYGVKPIIYTGSRYYQDYLTHDDFKEYVIWVAHYGVRSPAIENSWHFWQFTDQGALQGVRGKVDLNVYKGSVEELKTLCIP